MSIFGLVAVLVALAVVLVLLAAVVVGAVLLIRLARRPAQPPTGTRTPPGWTDDDEISAREHH